MKQTTLREILLDPTKKVSEAENILARLFRDMLAERGILPSQWDARMDAYYRRIHTNSKGEVDVVKVNQDKSNLQKALAKNTIPWNRFETAIQVLGPDEYTFTLAMKYNDVEFNHKIRVKNRKSAPVPPVEEDEDD